MMGQHGCGTLQKREKMTNTTADDAVDVPVQGLALREGRWPAGQGRLSRVMRRLRTG